MRFCAVTLSLALLGCFATSAFAQGGGCRGGGRGPAMGSMGTERASAFRMPLVNSTEMAQRYMLQVQQQEMARTNYLQMQQSARQFAQQAADVKKQKRQERIAALRERRAAEVARREAAIARRKASQSEVATYNQTASLP